MKLVMDEKVKHRLIGLAVILSIGAIFAPAIMKKSNQRFDGNVSVSVELPPKPRQPKVAISDEKAMFAAVKVAHVELPAPSERESLPTTAKAEPLSPMNHRKIKAAPVIAKADIPIVKKVNPVASRPAAVTASTKSVAKATPAPKAVAAAKVAKTPEKLLAKNNKTVKPVAKTNYAVQLALFSKQQNAQSLVTKLRGKGYKAVYNKIQTNGGTAYKVLVGQTNKREQAQRLKQQLATVMQMKGFVVSTTGQG